MTFQAYIDNIKAKTGKSPEDFKKLAEKKGLLKKDMNEPTESRLKQSPQARDFSSRVRSSTKTNVTSDFVK